MNISEEELRMMVREAIARHASVDAARRPEAADPRGHASHVRLAIVAGGDNEGHCLIEPAVRCSHCGYCQSLGH